MQIMPGSLEWNPPRLTAGVHTGTHEYDIQNLRYVSIDLPNGGPSGQTVLECLTEVYNNSTGCLVKGTFKLK